jgi:hypothetical protein
VVLDVRSAAAYDAGHVRALTASPGETSRSSGSTTSPRMPSSWSIAPALTATGPTRQPSGSPGSVAV